MDQMGSSFTTILTSSTSVTIDAAAGRLLSAVAADRSASTIAALSRHLQRPRTVQNPISTDRSSTYNTRDTHVHTRDRQTRVHDTVHTSLHHWAGARCGAPDATTHQLRIVCARGPHTRRACCHDSTGRNPAGASVSRLSAEPKRGSRHGSKLSQHVCFFPCRSTFFLKKSWYQSRA